MTFSGNVSIHENDVVDNNVKRSNRCISDKRADKLYCKRGERKSDNLSRKYSKTCLKMKPFEEF